MRIIIRLLFYTLAFSVLIYAGMFMLSIRQYPPAVIHVIDTKTGSDIYRGSGQQVVMERELLRSAAPKIIFLGASNTQEGFRPDRIKVYFPLYEVHNLSIGASDLTQTKQVIELVYEMVREEDRPKVVFVLGLWYGALVENSVRWTTPFTDFENEQLRYGLYVKESGDIRAAIPPKLFSFYIKFLYPYLAFDRALGVSKEFVKQFFEDSARFLLKGQRQRSPPHLQDSKDIDSVIVDQADRKHAFKYWHEYMGREDDTISTEQLDVLLDIAQLVKENGSRFVIIDMPIPAWHAQQSAHFRDYQTKKKEYLFKAVSDYGASYFDMQKFDNDFDFYDSAHPKPRTTQEWSRVAAGKLKGFLE